MFLSHGSIKQSCLSLTSSIEISRITKQVCFLCVVGMKYSCFLKDHIINDGQMIMITTTITRIKTTTKMKTTLKMTTKTTTKMIKNMTTKTTTQMDTKTTTRKVKHTTTMTTTETT